LDAALIVAHPLATQADRGAAMAKTITPNDHKYAADKQDRQEAGPLAGDRAEVVA
jgi:hypothetical protein